MGAAWREDPDALVETLSAEIAHEVRYPINFFRSIFVRAADNPLLDKDDVAIGHEEVERLERLVSGLRRAAVQRVDRRIVQVAELCSRAEALVRDRVGNSTMILDVADDDVFAATSTRSRRSSSTCSTTHSTPSAKGARWG